MYIHIIISTITNSIQDIMCVREWEKKKNRMRLSERSVDDFV